MSESRFKGTIKFFNPKSNFGFIILADTGQEIYFNQKSTGGIQLEVGDRVTFTMGEAKRGPVAMNIIKQNE
jgi:CspA family cold shock protein